MLASLVLCGALINVGTVKANCFDDFVANNPDATVFECCSPSPQNANLTVPATITELTKLTSINFGMLCDVIGTFPTAGWDKLVDLKEL